MRYSMINRLLCTAALMALTACGGGGSTTGNQPMVVSSSGMPQADLEKLHGRKIIGPLDEKMTFASLATTHVSTAPFDEDTGRMDGSISFGDVRDAKGNPVNGPSIIVEVGPYEDYKATYNPDLSQAKNNLGDPMIQTSSYGTINGQRVFLGRRQDSAIRESFLIVPDPASNMYAGVFVHDAMGIAARHGIYGRKTTQSELSIMRGGATFSGSGAASVDRYDGVTDKAIGLYEGKTAGTVNFSNQSFSIKGNFGRKREDSAATDAFSMTSNGTFGANGRLTGQTRYEGIAVDGKTLTGDFEGNLFGPGAQTLGGTFIGSDSARVELDRGFDDVHANVVGHVLMNKN